MKEQPDRIATRASRRAVLKGAAGAVALAVTGSARAQRDTSDTDVVVVGAGLSGLGAALLLEAEGLTVQVLESRSRVGGRLFTVDDVPGAPEAGGNVIGPMYARLFDMARTLDVELEPMRPREPVEYAADGGEGAVLNLSGEFVRLTDWPDHPKNPFPADLKKTMPWDFRAAALAPLNPLKELDDWLNSRFASYDVSIAAALEGAGFAPQAIDFGVAENQGYGNSVHDVSALHIHQLMTWGMHQSRGEGVFHIKGGNQRLPEAMAAALKQSRVIFKQRVTGVRSDDRSVEVYTENGDRYRGRAALVTLPFTAARSLKFDPPLTGRQAQAVHMLNYSTTTQILCSVTAPYWEQDEFPATMWTDTPMGQLLGYPYGENGETVSAAIWMMGADALLADRYRQAELIKRSFKILERLRPAAAAALKPLKVLSWQRDPNTGGTWASWGPGQISEFANTMALPHGRIHFAGEHTAKLERGMEGALESGERAALEILDRLS